MSKSRNKLRPLGLTAALIMVCGCQGEQAPINDEPRVAPSGRPLENIKNDLKPPVIVGPGAPPTSGAPSGEQKP